MVLSSLLYSLCVDTSAFCGEVLANGGSMRPRLSLGVAQNYLICIQQSYFLASCSAFSQIIVTLSDEVPFVYVATKEHEEKKWPRKAYSLLRWELDST